MAWTISGGKSRGPAVWMNTSKRFGAEELSIGSIRNSAVLDK